MKSNFDVNNFKTPRHKHFRYLKRIRHIEEVDRKNTSSIKIAVEDSIKNIKEKRSKSFVIYGEPQSGKTEMMIALTARLLDEGYKIIIILLNDNVQLLNQNLERFKRSGLDPAPQNFNEILDPSIKIKNEERVIFCTKNSKNLQKLIDKIGNINGKVIIDDEADYATPNAKINKNEVTRINGLVGRLLRQNDKDQDGIYIGVTATPARLDLNNVFENDSQNWVNFPPHSNYTGQDDFFPIDTNNRKFQLNLLPDKGDDPKYLRKALFSFLVNVAYLNTIDSNREENYCMLVHTSGKKVDQDKDYRDIVGFFEVLADEENKRYENYIKDIWKIAKERYYGEEDKITNYIRENRGRKGIVMINCDADKNQIPDATNPSTLFTVAIGGNIVSRGMTFDNLLSMFFTRDVKNKIQQDTYIQRARMFGSRGPYLKFFELSIPKELYKNWNSCFVFHRLALGSINSGNMPTWLEDKRISAVATSSIDKSAISINSGTMNFARFEYSNKIDNLVNKKIDPMQKLKELNIELGDLSVPKYLIYFIQKYPSQDLDDTIVFHKSTDMSEYKSEIDIENVKRTKGGMMGTGELEKNKYPNVIHHLKIYFINNKAKLYYKYEADNGIKFIGKKLNYD